MILKPLNSISIVIISLFTFANANASFHLFDISEVYSNTDGTVQYIELFSSSSGQQFINNHSISSNANNFLFTSNLPSDSAGKFFLVGTAGVAAATGVTPDYIVSDNFFNTTTDTLNFASVDSVSISNLPTDGVTALHTLGANTQNAGTPTNFSGNTATLVSNTPTTNNVDFSTNTDIALTINITDTDDTGSSPIAVDNDTATASLTFVNVQAVTSLNGAVTGVNSSTLVYTPPSGINGNDTFTFSVSDGSNTSASPSTMTIAISNPLVNTNPNCANVDLSTPKNTPLSISVANKIITECSDNDGDTLTLLNVSQPSNSASALANDGAGTLTYTPATDFTGNDSFTFTISDGQGGTDNATVSITVAEITSTTSNDDGGGGLYPYSLLLMMLSPIIARRFLANKNKHSI